MAWYDEAVFYHIYPLGLANAPKTNSYGEPEHRLNTLLPWISHIREIGCNALYIGPLFESVGHGYETTDYKKLDSRLGTNEDLTAFVKACHDQGIRVILDGVFNHTGRDFFAFQDIKKNRENSPYKDWYCRVNFWGNNEYNDGFSYENWGGYDLLAKLNQNNPAVRDYICDVIRFWAREFKIDGIRLDAADVLDFGYMQALRHTAGEIGPDFWLMGEVIHGDYTRWVNEGTLHSVTNYHLHKALYSGHNDHNYFEIAHTVRRLYEMGGNRPDGLKLYNFADNHDVERIYTKLNNKAHYAPVHILMYTLPGVPSIYYGSEFGIEGKKERYSDDSLRPALSLEDYEDALENNDCTRLIRALGTVRQKVKALSYGDYKELALTNRQYGFARSYEGETVIIAVNNDDNEASMCFPAMDGQIYRNALSGETARAEGGRLCITVAANGGGIWIPYEDGAWTNPDGERANEESCKGENPKSGGKPANAGTKETAGKAPCPEETAGDRPAAEEQPEILDGQRPQEEPKAPAAQLSDKQPEVPAARLSNGQPGILDGRSQKEQQEAVTAGKAVEPCEDSDKPKTHKTYEEMSIEELQQAILDRMAMNGPVTDRMRQDVAENVYHNSLINWIKSFR